MTAQEQGTKKDQIMIFAYADPPYIGQSKKHYKDHPDYDGEVDHRELIFNLMKDFPDGWVLSQGSRTLREILNYAHEAGAIDVRIGAWVKPWAIYNDKNVAYAWEPILWRGGRKRNWRIRDTVKDWVMANAVMNREDDPNHTKGTKPDEFCFWIFELLGMEIQDNLIDLYPGSGAVTKSWEKWKRQGKLFLKPPLSRAVI
jgi:hypothetical protein